MSKQLDPEDALALIQSALWAAGLNRLPHEIVDDAENASHFFLRNAAEVEVFRNLFGMCANLLGKTTKSWTASEAAHMAEQLLTSLRMTSTLDKALGLSDGARWN